MSSVESIIHKGKRICIVDISNLQPQDAISTLKESHYQIGKLISKTALIVTDLTNAIYNKESDSTIKKFLTRKTHYIKASAIVGADWMRSFFIKIIVFFTGREIKLFKTRMEALDWLATK